MPPQKDSLNLTPRAVAGVSNLDDSNLAERIRIVTGLNRLLLDRLSLLNPAIPGRF
jgi:hypothetical protein